MYLEFCSNWLRLITLCKNVTLFWSCGPDYIVFPPSSNCMYHLIFPRSLNCINHLTKFFTMHRSSALTAKIIRAPSCSKLMTSLVNVSFKFQTLISKICQYFLLKKCEKLLHCKSFSHFFNKKYQCFWL